MTEMVIKALREIRRAEYIRWIWLDCTQVMDAETMMLRGRERTPAECLVAAAEFDVYREAWKAVGNE